MDLQFSVLAPLFHYHFIQPREVPQILQPIQMSRKYYLSQEGQEYLAKGKEYVIQKYLEIEKQYLNFRTSAF